MVGVVVLCDFTVVFVYMLPSYASVDNSSRLYDSAVYFV